MSYFGVPELDRNMDGLMALVDKLDTVQERLSELTGSATSADDYITVILDSKGRVSELTLNPRALRLPSADLAESLMVTVNQAQTALQDNTRALMAELSEAAGLDISAAMDGTANVKDAVSDLLRAGRGGLSPEEVTAAVMEATSKVTGLESQ